MIQLKQWAKAAGVRALKTFAQALIAALPTTAVTLGGVDWAVALSTAAVAAIVSLLTSVAGIPEVADGASVAALGKGGE